MEKDYSNREIDHLFGDIKTQLNRIEHQTTKHNGRLTSIEKWMWTLAGGLAVLAFLVAQKLLTLSTLT